MGSHADGMVALVDAVLSSRRMREDSLNSLRENLFTTMKQIQTDHMEMATNQRNQLGAFMNDLRSAVGTLRSECQDAKREAQADNRAAHAAWFGPRPKKRK